MKSYLRDQASSDAAVGFHSLVLLRELAQPKAGVAVLASMLSNGP